MPDEPSVKLQEGMPHSKGVVSTHILDLGLISEKFGSGLKGYEGHKYRQYPPCYSYIGRRIGIFRIMCRIIVANAFTTAC